MSEPSSFTPVLTVTELSPGQMRCVDVHGVPVLLVNSKDGSLHAVHNICTHAFARMDEGRLRGHRLICPLHGASFDVRTGAVLGAPATVPLASYPVRIAGDQIEVQVRS
jgi:3-phenylpropionate/trans-cinnamate dioxygenase ferredoxin component